jgi:hypothetical protein
LAARVHANRMGDPLLAETEVGPVILPREASRMSGCIEEAVARGVQLIGGGLLSDTTVMPRSSSSRRPTPTSHIFGPVTCVPNGFLLGLALWGAACGLVAKLLCNFAACAAALDGYTAAIIASDGLGATGALMARFSYSL